MGFEPKIDGAGEITSQICDIDYREDRLLFTHYELAGDGQQTCEINRYFEAGAVALGQIFTTNGLALLEFNIIRFYCIV